MDLEVTPNGKVAVVRGNIPGVVSASDWKLSLWRTETGTRILPNVQNAVGKGNLSLNTAGKVLSSPSSIGGTQRRA